MRNLSMKNLAMFMTCVMLFLLLGFHVEVHAANPYIPLWDHVPDAEPRLFEDPDNLGKYRVYLYGSHDTLKTAYCGNDLEVWSAPADDLNNWRYDGVSFQSIVNGTADILYAPDVVEVKDANGKKTYYLYPNNQASGRGSMVAKSDRPAGPFTVINWKADSTTLTEGISGFDPAVFVDDDGRVYAYWGYRNSYAAELDPNTMCTIKSGATTITDMIGSCDATDGNDYRFFEASSLRKVKDKYVFIYSRKTKDNEFGTSASNATLAYAYSDTPLGPWTYGGTIVDARARDLGENREIITTQPGVNTHGSILQVSGQWYVFYHRSINSDGFSRQAMVAPINVDVTADGKVVISEAEVNSEGFELGGLNPYENHSAGIASYQRGGSYVKAVYDDRANEAPVVNIKNNSIVGFKYFNFDGKPADGQSTQLEMYTTPKGVDGTVDIMMDSPWLSQGGTKLGTINIFKDAVQQKTKMIVPVPGVDGVDGKHGIYFVFKSASSNEICYFNDLKFSKIEASLFNDSFTSGLDKWKINTGNPTMDNGLSMTNSASITSKYGSDWKNYEFDNNVNLSTGSVGLRFMQLDEKNYYELQLKDGNLELYSVLYGSKTVLEKTSGVFKTNESELVSVTCVNSVITVRINGIMVLQHQNQKDHEYGTIGFCTYDGASVKISSVQVQNASQEELLLATYSIFVDGVKLPNFEISNYNYTYKVSGNTTPKITAVSSDKDEIVSISQADNAQGTAVVRFIKGEKVRTYRIAFTSSELISFANGIPTGWEVINPSDPQTAISTSTSGAITIATYKGDTDYPNSHNMLQFSGSAIGNWTLTTQITTDKPLTDITIQEASLVGIGVYRASSGEHYRISTKKVINNIKVYNSGKSGTTIFANTSGTNLTGSSYWVRIVKTGNALQGYYSIDQGVTYKSMGTAVAFTSDFFENAKLQLFATNLSTTNDFKATFSNITIVKTSGDAGEVDLDQQAVEQAAVLIGNSIAVPSTDADNLVTLQTKAQQLLDNNANLISLGVTCKISNQDGQFALSISKGVSSLTINWFTIETPSVTPITLLTVVNENSVDYFALGSDAKIKIKVKNNLSQAQNVALLVGLFNSNNTMLTYGASQQSIGINNEVELEVMLTMPSSGNYTVRYFVWDSLENHRAFNGVSPVDISVQ